MAKSNSNTMEELLASLSGTILTLTPGSEVEGEIVSINQNEIIVDLGLKSEGVIPLREVSDSKYKAGDKIKAQVGEGENESGQIILTLAGPDRGLSSSTKVKPKSDIAPEKWASLAKKFENEETIKGKVVKSTQFGVFVTLEEGIEGLIHSSKLGPDDTFEAGKEISVTIDNLDKERQRMSLTPVLTSTKGLIYK